MAGPYPVSRGRAAGRSRGRRGLRRRPEGSRRPEQRRPCSSLLRWRPSWSGEAGAGRGPGPGVAGRAARGKGLRGSGGRRRRWRGWRTEAGVWPAAVGSSWLIQPGQGGRKCASLEKGPGPAAGQAGEEVPLSFVAGWGALGRGEAVGWEGLGSRLVSSGTPPSHPSLCRAGWRPPGQMKTITLISPPREPPRSQALPEAVQVGIIEASLPIWQMRKQRPKEVR